MFKNKRVNSNAVLLLVVFVLCIANSGCVGLGLKPKKISILPSKPATGFSACLSIETLFSSDNKIILVSDWDTVFESKKHTRKWEILNNNGDEIFSRVFEDQTTKRNVINYLEVPLKGEIKKGLIPGKLTINLYVDDAIVKSKIINYEEKSAINKTIRRIVLLPFVEVNVYPQPWSTKSKNFFQNVMTDATYIEIKRFFPLMAHPRIAKIKTEKYWEPNCLDSKECINDLKKAFGESIIIHGDVSIQRANLDSSNMIVWVFDAKTGSKKEFRFLNRYLGSFSDLMQSLVKGILYDRELIKYLRTL